MPDVTRIADTLESFLRERFQIAADDRNFSRGINLWEEGYVDSLGTAEVVAFIEAAFEVVVPPDALFSERSTTVSGLAELVAELQRASAPVT